MRWPDVRRGEPFVWHSEGQNKMIAQGYGVIHYEISLNRAIIINTFNAAFTIIIYLAGARRSS
jgi:hypothetical protein